MSSSSAPQSPTQESSGSQTRFSFYNADEYKVSSTSPTTNGPAPQQRFHFYNANEIRLTETVLQTVDGTDSTTAENKMDSTEILKSLQEHEQQRLSILTSAGTEEPTIPEASCTTKQENDLESVTIQTRDSQPEIQAPPLPLGDREENLESIRPSSDQSSTCHTHNESIDDQNVETDTDTLQSNPYQEAIHEALELLRRQRSPYQQEVDLRRQQRQERLQKYSARLQELKQQEDEMLVIPAASSLSSASAFDGGVEIETTATAPAVERVLLAILQKADTEQHQQSGDDETNEKDEDDALLKAMSGFLVSKSQDDELQSQDESDKPFPLEGHARASHLGEMDCEVESETKEQHEELDRTTFDGDKPVQDSYPEDEETSYPRGKNVLGPLGQKTGVVLDNGVEEDDDDGDDDDLVTEQEEPSSASYRSEVETSCRSEVETSEQSSTTTSRSASTASSSSAPTHILDSLSAAVSYMTGGVRSETADTPDDDDEEEEDGDEDNETKILRSLCAHLLPHSNIPRPFWDEENPDELGYRIVRISNEQLERMEDELQEILDDYSNKNVAEKRKNIVPIETAVAKSPEKKGAIENSPLEHFPGIKSSGGGEMGDLEYFSLPVIYKSHVTGFEPVKDMVLEPGNVLAGQYLVEGVLGSAAFSTAYKCVDLSSNIEVCLKVIKNTKDFFDQSLDEIKILELLRQTGRCQENYIVEMKTFFYHREHLIIVTELLRQNLFEFGKFIMDSGEEAYFTLPRLAYVTRQCLISLRFVHSLGLVHSDVKPENILLSSYSRASVKLIDFGSSCYLTDRQSSYIQSRSYRAPEVCLGLPYDGRIDVWSLGCVVAEMFTGEVTFQNDSVVSMLSRIEAICGAFPRHMMANGRQSSHFFTKTGLLFDRERDDSVDIFQPKATLLSSRLGHPNDEVFVDFIRKLLTIDPEVRPTAEQALEHPWMKYAATLTENDIIYPTP